MLANIAIATFAIFRVVLWQTIAKMAIATFAIICYKY